MSDRPFLSFLAWPLVALAGLVATGATLGAEAPRAPERWDLRMIAEGRIWPNLLVGYAYADRKKHWPERKAALSKIIKDFPDSRWADDAALVLAGGMASLENNWRGACKRLAALAQASGEHGTVVEAWDADMGFRFDPTWLMWRGSLVFLNKDGTIRHSKPWGRHGPLSSGEQEALALFHHLDRWPRRTADVARLTIAQIHHRNGDLKGAVAALEELLSRMRDLVQTAQADREAASRQHCRLIRGVWRPEYAACLHLIWLYEQQGQHDRSIALGRLFAHASSRDGWYPWHINRTVGDICAKYKRWKEAEEQYTVALAGAKMWIADLKERPKPPSPAVVQRWERRAREMERKLKAVMEHRRAPQLRR